MIIITSSSKAAWKMNTLSEPAWPNELMREIVSGGLYAPWETLERTPATTPPENSAQTLAQIGPWCLCKRHGAWNLTTQRQSQRSQPKVLKTEIKHHIQQQVQMLQ